MKRRTPVVVARRKAEGWALEQDLRMLARSGSIERNGSHALSEVDPRKQGQTLTLHRRFGPLNGHTESSVRAEH